MAQVFRFRLSLALCVLLAASPAWAEEAGISVNGIGTARGRPTEVEIAATVSGDGELAADANVKYTDLKKKALDAVAALKIANLSVISDGPAISQALDAAAQMRAMQGQPAVGNTKQRIQISEQLRLELKEADKLPPDGLIETVLKMVDACRDAGLQIGPPPASNYYQMQIRAQTGTADTLVAFKIPDISALENQAYQQAVNDARSKAQRIADLTGVKLGQVVSVQDEGFAPTMQARMQPGNGAATGIGDNEISSAALSDVLITVHLTIKFEIAK